MLTTVFVPVAVQAHERGQASTSLRQLSQIQAAVQLYAADANNHVPYAVGNTCYHQAVDRNQGCDAVPALFIRELVPLNAVLATYQVPTEAYRSPVDHMERYFPQSAGYKPTWFEESTTARYPGSSFEYTTRYGLLSRSLSSFGASSATILIASMFSIGDGAAAKRQIAFADGHAQTLPIREVGDLLMRQD